jgi:UDP-N-acetylglucosamine 2-epimerase (non-hydrolysing)
MTPEMLAVVGARPNFVKVAPVIHALERLGTVRVRVLHTGQHYDERLAGSFLERLGFPPVEFALGVGSGTHAEQTAAVMVGVERVLSEHSFAGVLVSGDVNSTMAAALAAVKMGVPVAHLEAGLRSGDREMPEEINRIVTDRVADLLLCHSEDALENLAREGVPPEQIELVGNTMIDSLFDLLPLAEESMALDRLALERHGFVLVTLHRPSLVDHAEKLEAVLGVLRDLAQRIPVVLPLHPRTRARLAAADCALEGLVALEPLDYLDFIALEGAARLVITDSGGVQEETSALGVPCITYRTTTERPVTITHGTNRLVGVDADALGRACEEMLEAEPRSTLVPEIPLWDGHAGERAAAAIGTRLLSAAPA